MIRKNKFKAKTIIIVVIMVLIANITAISLALFTREYNNYNSGLLVFGSVDVNPTIKKSGEEDYKNYIELSTSDLIAGNKLYYDLKLTMNTNVYVKFETSLQIKNKTTNVYETKTDALSQNYVSLDILNTSGSSGTSIVNTATAPCFKQGKGYVYSSNSLTSGTKTLPVCLTISDNFGSVLNGGEIINNSSCRIILEIESMQESGDLSEWENMVVDTSGYSLAYEGSNPILLNDGVKVENATYLSDVSATVGTDNVDAFMLADNETMVIVGSGALKNSAFENNLSLINLIIGKGVTSIGSDAFDSCTGLTSVVFEENSSLSNIEDYAFYNCTDLESIIIPASVNSIGAEVFYTSYNDIQITIYMEHTSESVVTNLDENWNALHDTEALVYWYSEEPNYDGAHWHYVNGEPTEWVE